jgi:hypothetical protein
MADIGNAQAQQSQRPLGGLGCGKIYQPPEAV